MKLAELQNKLVAAARSQAPDERVPYAFEKRIMAQLAARKAVDRRALWAQALWRAAITCVAVAVVAFLISFFTLPATPDNSRDLSQDFENTLLASIDQPEHSQLP
jgi:anti-sigma-K factor RskA